MKIITIGDLMHSDAFYSHYLKTERNVWKKTLKFNANFIGFMSENKEPESFIVSLVFKNITLMGKSEIQKLKKLAEKDDNLASYFEHRRATKVENRLARVYLVIKQRHVAMLKLLLNTDVDYFDTAKLLLIESIIKDEVKDEDEIEFILEETLTAPDKDEDKKYKLQDYIYDERISGFMKKDNETLSSGIVNNEKFMLIAFLIDNRRNLTFGQFLKFPLLSVSSDDLPLLIQKEKSIYEYEGEINFSKVDGLLRNEIEKIADFNLSYAYRKLFERDLEIKYKVSKADFYNHLFESSQIVKELSTLMEFENNTKSSFNNLIVHCFCYLMVNHSLEDAVELSTTYLNSDTTMRNYFYDDEFLSKFMEYFNNETNVMSLEMWLNISDVLDPDFEKLSNP